MIDPQLALYHDERPAKQPLPNRSECRGGHRPCPFASCRHHLLVTHTTTNLREALRVGTPLVAYNAVLSERYGLTHQQIEAFPLVALHALPETCSLDVADRGPHTLDEIRELLGTSREAVRQVEHTATRHLRNGMYRRKLRELLDMSNEMQAGQYRDNPTKPAKARGDISGSQTSVIHFQQPPTGKRKVTA